MAARMSPELKIAVLGWSTDWQLRFATTNVSHCADPGLTVVLIAIRRRALPTIHFNTERAICVPSSQLLHWSLRN